MITDKTTNWNQISMTTTTRHRPSAATSTWDSRRGWLVRGWNPRSCTRVLRKRKLTFTTIQLMSRLLLTNRLMLKSITSYSPQRSFGKVIFLHLSAILFTGVGCLPHLPGRYPWADTPLGRHPWADTPRPVHTGIRSTNGRYASYWNAFLFADNFVIDL